MEERECERAREKSCKYSLLIRGAKSARVKTRSINAWSACEKCSFVSPGNNLFRTHISPKRAMKMFILRFIAVGSYFIVADILLSRYVNFIMQIIALIVLSFPTTIFFLFYSRVFK